MRSALAITSVATLLAGCRDAPNAPTSTSALDPLRAATSVNGGPSSVDAERTALEALTKGVALALRNPQLRAQIRDNMRDSPALEHKLHWARYTQGKGHGLVTALAHELGISDSAATATLASVRELEFYMPVRAHRATWSGDGNLLVAMQLGRHDTPIGYTLRGERVMLPLDTAPSTPTLVLVPLATNFDAISTVPATQPATVRSVIGGAMIERGALDHAPRAPRAKSTIPHTASPRGPRTMVACDTYCGGSPMPEIVPASAPAGLYMTYSNVYNTQEPWTRGDPELEMHVISRFGPAKDRAGTVLCSAAGVSDPLRRYDQNNNEWHGAVMILNDAEVAQYNYVDGAPDGERFLMQMWEDDYATCQLYTTANVAERGLIFLGYGTAFVWGGLHCAGARSDPAWWCGIALYEGTWYVSRGTWTVIQSIFGGEDDLVGTVIPNDVARSRGITPDAGTTHTLIDIDGAKGGGITLVRKNSGEALYGITY